MLNKKIIYATAFILSMFFCWKASAQQKADTTKKTGDSTSRKNILALDTSAKKFNPKIATFRSAVLPGWGQAYNKKYWKIPVVYGALGITAFIFFDNLKTYQKLREAIVLRSDTIAGNDILVDERFRNLSTGAIRTNRSLYRQNVDYSVLVFIIFWGLNVVDATVDAHLKAFDVSDNISLKIKPGYNPTSNTGGISLVFSFKDKYSKALTSQR